MSTKQLEVQIMGQSYLLGCPEGGQARLLAAVDKVDQAMCKVRDAGKIKARDRIAVLAALNLAFEQTDAQAAPQSDKAHDSGEAAPADSTQASDSARLELLLKRLDNALHQDGQLI
jgi:cell division protein ZapA